MGKINKCLKRIYIFTVLTSENKQVETKNRYTRYREYMYSEFYIHEMTEQTEVYSINVST